MEEERVLDRFALTATAQQTTTAINKNQQGRLTCECHREAADETVELARPPRVVELLDDRDHVVGVEGQLVVVPRRVVAHALTMEGDRDCDGD